MTVEEITLLSLKQMNYKSKEGKDNPPTSTCRENEGPVYKTKKEALLDVQRDQRHRDNKAQ